MGEFFQGDGGNMKRTVVAAAIGECVHVAGVMNFLRLAEASGWRTVFLGPATPISALLEAAKRGSNLGDAARAAKVFPILVCQMIRIGEETGHLDDMLEKVAFLDQRLAARPERLRVSLAGIGEAEEKSFHLFRELHCTCT